MCTQLISDKLKRNIENFPLYSQDNKGRNALCIGVLYIGDIRWYVLEGNTNANDTLLYTIVCGMHETEYGYCSVNEMKNISVNSNGITFKIEEVPDFEPVPLNDIHDEELQAFLNRMYANED